ncbi:uncharacterized protein LOC143254028 isoform X1 [Tachypleus tridentatus]|uniref:uncharacterized protein LOC143254028 isoform X1 n=1 Tax=Tachypleus tridentatus TaxID=6853 RepID=UPI003FD3CFFF
MTPYVVDEDKNNSALAKPKSTMVHNFMNGETAQPENESKPNGETNGISVDAVPEMRFVGRGTPVTPSKGIINGRVLGGQTLTNGKTNEERVLKRVSFGSSKGSMVETLIYDHQDDLMEFPMYIVPLAVNGEETPLKPPAKVRVTFYESQKPNFVTTPESPDVPFDLIVPPNMASSPAMEEPPRDHQQSTESDLDNPFRPDGELSREAETIVSLIKEGKPITPTKMETDDSGLGDVTQSPEDVQEPLVSPAQAISQNDAKPDANGRAPTDKTTTAPAVVEVQHGLVPPPTEAQQVEPVLIQKKKPKGKCCVIQ